MKVLLLYVCLCFLPFTLFGKIYKGAEYRTKEAYTYGRFEVKMKSAQREGMLSSFFTYHENTSTADWNEIDIEILGRYSDDVQFNPITPGQVNHVSHCYTPFNPGLDFHTYAIEWTPSYVAWFIDGEEVHRQTGAHIEALNLPQKIMMNVWNPAYQNWAGTWNENILPAFAYYDWVSYSSYTPGMGNTGTDNNFSLQWKDEFDSWDQSRWEKATHTWDGNGCDFVQSNAVIQNGNLILCLTKETALGYTDTSGPNIIAVRGEKEGLLVLFSEEVDSATAVDVNNYSLTGKTISQANLLSDKKSVKLSALDYEIGSVSSIIIKNVKDQFVNANTMSAKNVSITNSTPLVFPIKINCAGSSYKSYLPDKAWSPLVEYGYMDGIFYSNTESFPTSTDPGVFNTELNGAAKYMVRVPNGTYIIILMMSENYFTSAGKRIFSVAVQGNVVEKNLDLYAEVGKSKPYQKIVQNVTVSQGVLNIHFMNQTDAALINAIQIYQTSTNVSERFHPKPVSWSVEQNYPNPFNGQTNIPVNLPNDDYLIMKFYDILGKLVSEVTIGDLNAGKHILHWEGRGLNGITLASGVYYCTVQGERHSITKKFLLLQ